MTGLLITGAFMAAVPLGWRFVDWLLRRQEKPMRNVTPRGDA